MNTGVAWPIDSTEAWARVLRMQTKLHRWAVAEPGRRFDDVFNPVCDTAFLAAAWDRVRTNKGARTAGVDQIAPAVDPRQCSAEVDPQQQQDPLVGDSDDGGSDRAGVAEVGVGADFRGRCRTILVWSPAEKTGAGRDRGDPLPRLEHPHVTTGWVFEADMTACFDEIDHTALTEPGPWSYLR